MCFKLGLSIKFLRLVIITEVPSWLALRQENFNFWVLWSLESRLVGISITCLQNSRYADVTNPFLCKPFVFLQNVWILLYLPLARVLMAKRELIMLYKRKLNPFLSVFWRRLADIKVLRINTEYPVLFVDVIMCLNESVFFYVTEYGYCTGCSWRVRYVF